MDLNFADLKKEAAATSEDIFGQAKEATKQTAAEFQNDLLEGLNTSAGAQDFNAHTEHYFANDQKDLDFEHVDPQTFVQRMSAGAKDAKEQLDAKFAQPANDFDDFLSGASQKFDDFGSNLQQSAQQEMAALTNDFMNVERSLFGAGDLSKPPPKVDNAPDTLAHTDDLLNLNTGTTGDGDSQFVPSAPLAPLMPSAPASNFYEDEFGVPSFVVKSSTAVGPVTSNKDSDTDSPSVSYNPSPAKKNPVADALKEQDNDKFISSEDLLGDIKDERTATPEFQSLAGTATKPSIPTTDLDADDDFEPTVKPSIEKSKVEPIPQAPVAKDEPKPAPKVESVPEPAPKAEMKPVKPTAGSFKAPVQPTLMATDHILFFKNSLDAWFKPERLHPKVESLIYWRDVKKSGIVFGAGLVILLAISCFSVISVIAYLSLMVLAGTIAFRVYKTVMQAIQKTSDGHPFREYLNIDLQLSQDKTQHIAGVAVSHLNGFIAELRRLFLVEDLVDSIKFAVILWAMTYIGAWFNGMTLVILAFVSLFTLPKVYENNKQSIDTYLDLVRSKLTEVTDKVKDAIPIGVKKTVEGETDKDK